MKVIEGWLTAPRGFIAAGVKAGIKKNGKEDVGLVVSEVPAACGAVFTQNIMASPAVSFSRRIARGDYARAIAVNAGCANACTGGRGWQDACRMAEITAALLNCRDDEVFVCSTGTTGQFLPMDKIAAGLNSAAGALSADGGEAVALSIQTTDTFVKRSAYEFTLEGKQARVAGIAKGAGMIHPNMATLLTFITTDAAIAPALLKRAVKAVADLSFNMVVIDGDTSTNDSMIVLANGLCGNQQIDSEQHPDYAEFFDALLAVSVDLSKMIARDGEGATKFLTVTVQEAPDFAAAKTIAMSIAKSPLVKTAFFGQDPNWGRIVCAAGYAGIPFEPETTTVSLNDLIIFTKGISAAADTVKLAEVMKEHDITVKISLGAGKAEATVWTCDFSYDYVKVNASYRT